MPSVPGRAPNPSYYRGIAGAKDQFPEIKKSSNQSSQWAAAAPPPPWGGYSEPVRKPVIGKISAAEEKRRGARLDAQSARVDIEKKRRAAGAPNAEDRINLRTFSRAQLAEARATNHQEANNILAVMAEKGRDGKLSAAELKTIASCVNLVKKMGAYPNDAKLALEELIATQNPTTRGVETLKKLFASLG